MLGMDDQDPNELLTLSQAAQEFAVRHSRLRMAAWQSRLPCIKPGHDYLVRREDVAAFLARSRRGRPRSPELDAAINTTVNQNR